MGWILLQCDDELVIVTLGKRALLGSVVGLCLSVLATPAAVAHDPHGDLATLERDVERIYLTLNHLRATPPIPPPPRTVRDHLRILGTAEIEVGMGQIDRALQMLVGRLTDPEFQKLPAYLDTLLLTSQLLESKGEVDGAMSFARQALEKGGGPDQMAEAGARWFRLARRHQRTPDRLEMFEAWKRSGGLEAAGPEVAAEAYYEAAFALRDEARIPEAHRLLAQVRPDTRYGSRAVYLAGTLFVEAGDLQNAERWFGALMDWPLPGGETAPDAGLEREVRELAALAAARLRYERGDHALAKEAYLRIAETSPLRDEACFELAFLSFEARNKRGALGFLQCVMDLGVGGARSVDARLMRASLHAHLARYEDALLIYDRTRRAFAKEKRTFDETVRGLDDPVGFVFAAMERSGVDHGRKASPGPATLFQDVWTPDVDRAYRLTRDVDFAASETARIEREVASLIRLVQRENAFQPIDRRQEHLRSLLRDIIHLQSHVDDARFERKHASAEVLPSIDRRQALDEMFSVLSSYARAAEHDIQALDQERETRRNEALATLRSVAQDLEIIARLAQDLQRDAEPGTRLAVEEALRQVAEALEHASMRAEVGVLDTFWVKKEHSTQAIRALSLEREAIETEFTETLRELREPTGR